MAKSMTSFLGMLALAAGVSSATEVWAFRFDSISLAQSTSWHDDLIFHNTTAEDAVVHLLGVSNGGPPDGNPTEVTVPAGRTVSLKDLFGVWEPLQGGPLWVVHLDVPDGVLTFSRGGADGECPPPCGAPTNPLPNLGAFSMPVFRALSAPGQRQIHVGADLGTQPARINIGIYNAGTSTATATVSVYQACDDTVLETRTAAVPADTAAQFGGMGSALTQCPADTPLNTWLRYAVVTVDQPSLSYVVNLADPLPTLPRILLSVPVGP